MASGIVLGGSVLSSLGFSTGGASGSGGGTSFGGSNFGGTSVDLPLPGPVFRRSGPAGSALGWDLSAGAPTGGAALLGTGDVPGFGSSAVKPFVVKAAAIAANKMGFIVVIVSNRVKECNL